MSTRSLLFHAKLTGIFPLVKYTLLINFPSRQLSVTLCKIPDTLTNMSHQKRAQADTHLDVDVNILDYLFFMATRALLQEQVILLEEGVEENLSERPLRAVDSKLNLGNIRYEVGLITPQPTSRYSSATTPPRKYQITSSSANAFSNSPRCMVNATSLAKSLLPKPD